MRSGQPNYFFQSSNFPISILQPPTSPIRILRISPLCDMLLLENLLFRLMTTHAPCKAQVIPAQGFSVFAQLSRWSMVSRISFVVPMTSAKMDSNFGRPRSFWIASAIASALSFEGREMGVWLRYYENQQG